MEQTEEKQLTAITEEFEKGITAFKKRECQQSVDIFGRIVDTYKGSETESVLEVHARAQVYLKLCESRLKPPAPVLENQEDYLYDGIYHLNAGNLDTAVERFEYLVENNYNDPYLDYLFALVFLKKEDAESCLKHLKDAVEKDDTYKVIAHNEPEFDPMFENEDFVALIDLNG